MVSALLLALVPFVCLTGQAILRSDFRAASGYTFYAPVLSPAAYLIDNQGRIVHQWMGTSRAGQAVYLLANGNILRTGAARGPSVFETTAASGGRLEEFTPDGTLVWSYTLADERYLRHHDVAVMPNGNVLLIAFERKTLAEAIAAGRNPDRIAGGAVWAEAIFEVRPAPPKGGEIVWEWHAWDHLVQDLDPAKANYGDPGADPGRVDLNFSFTPQTPDWLHFNAIAYNAELDQIAVSSRTLSEIWVIDHLHDDGAGGSELRRPRQQGRRHPVSLGQSAGLSGRRPR